MFWCGLTEGSSRNSSSHSKYHHMNSFWINSPDNHWGWAWSQLASICLPFKLTPDESCLEKCLIDCFWTTWRFISKLIAMVDRYPSGDTPSASCCHSSVMSWRGLQICDIFEMRSCWAWILLKTPSVKKACWALVIVPCVNSGGKILGHVNRFLLSGIIWWYINTPKTQMPAVFFPCFWST